MKWASDASFQGNSILWNDGFYLWHSAEVPENVVVRKHAAENQILHFVQYVKSTLLVRLSIGRKYYGVQSSSWSAPEKPLMHQFFPKSLATRAGKSLETLNVDARSEYPIYFWEKFNFSQFLIFLPAMACTPMTLYYSIRAISAALLAPNWGARNSVPSPRFFVRLTPQTKLQSPQIEKCDALQTSEVFINSYFLLPCNL